jgi:AP-3 complex subunit delta-1
MIQAFTLGASASIQNSASTEGSQFEVGCAINCLSNICNPELAQELLSDLYGMMNSTRPYIRKKSVLVLFKIFQHWPKALRLSFPRLKEKLEDDDHSTFLLSNVQ